MSTMILAPRGVTQRIEHGDVILEIVETGEGWETKWRCYAVDAVTDKLRWYRCVTRDDVRERGEGLFAAVIQLYDEWATPT